jgi:hypothetical protein
MRASPKLFAAGHDDKPFRCAPPSKRVVIFPARHFLARIFYMAFSRNSMHELMLRAAPGISALHHRAILDAMDGKGMFGDNGGPVIRAVSAGKDQQRRVLSPRACAAAANDLDTANSLKSVQKRCQRAGFDFSLSDNEPLELHKIDRAFKAAREAGNPAADISETMAIKATLANLGLLA